MLSLPISSPTRNADAPRAAGPAWWTRLTRALAAEYRARHAARELHGLGAEMLRDIGLEHGGVAYAARFGRG